MPIDLSGGLDRFEADDLRQFTFIDTVSIPSTVTFIIYDTNGASLAPVAVQSGVTVTISGGDITKGLFYTFRQLPSSIGFYTYAWTAFGSGTAQSSLFTVTRGVFEIAKTEPRSFTSYGNKGNVLRVARQLVGRGDLTERDVEPHMTAAYGYINARLGAVVTVPLSPTPDYIAQGEEVLAVYTMHGTFGGTEKGEIPPAFTKLRDDFKEFIDGVVEGIITIDGTTRRSDPITFFNGGIEGGTPTFGRRDWTKQRLDQDILDAEADAAGDSDEDG